MSHVAALLLGGVALACAGPAAAAEPLRDGDIIFHTSRSAQSLAVQRATRSPYSHMGLIFHRGGKPFVLEAIATVRYTPLAQWTARGTGGKYAVRRLEDGLTAKQAARLRAAAEKYSARPYDFYFEWSTRASTVPSWSGRPIAMPWAWKSATGKSCGIST